MQIVTDTAVDIQPELIEALNIHVIPQTFTLDGKTYRSGVDVDVPGYYDLISKTDSFPTTAQPAPGEFAEVYRELAQDDPDILSIHISSGLSGTINAAVAAVEQVPEANVTIVDTKLLSIGSGWQVIAAAQAVKAGWKLDLILPTLDTLRAATDAQFTLGTLKYLIHGGRISHIRGLVAGLLDIKPLIGVDKGPGKYAQLGRARSIKKAIQNLVKLMAEKHGTAEKMRIQMIHGDAPESLDMLETALKDTFDINFLPTLQIAPILACHTGPTVVGFGIAPEATFSNLPE